MFRSNSGPPSGRARIFGIAGVPAIIAIDICILVVTAGMASTDKTCDEKEHKPPEGSEIGHGGVSQKRSEDHD